MAPVTLPISRAADTLRAGAAVPAIEADGATTLSAIAAPMAKTVILLKKKNRIFRGNIAIASVVTGEMAQSVAGKTSGLHATNASCRRDDKSVRADPPQGPLPDLCEERSASDARIHLIEPVKMMNRTMAVPDIETIRRGDGGGDVSFGATHRGFQILAFRQTGRDGG